MIVTRTLPRRHRRPARQARSEGFTLIELLTVIAIIALLLALMAPSLNHAKDLVYAAICRGNLHQMGIAMQMYKADTDFYPPGHSWAPTQPANVITWAPNLRLYASGGKEKLFYCPTAPAIAKWNVTFGSGLPAKWGYAADETRLYWNTPFSYGYNNWGTQDFASPQTGLGSMADWIPELLGNDPRRFMEWGPLPIHRVVAPWDMLAIGDSRVDGAWDAFIDHNQPGEFPNDAHLGKTNILFCDGRVDTEYAADLVDPTHTNPEARRRWNNDHQPH